MQDAKVLFAVFFFFSFFSLFACFACFACFVLLFVGPHTSTVFVDSTAFIRSNDTIILFIT